MPKDDSQSEWPTALGTGYVDPALALEHGLSMQRLHRSVDANLGPGPVAAPPKPSTLHGPIDPLTGNPMVSAPGISNKDLAILLSRLGLMTADLALLLRAQNPNVRCTLDTEGYAAINGVLQVKFNMDGKFVDCLSLYVHNLSSETITYDIDVQAGPNSDPIAPSGSITITQPVGFLSLFTTASVPINTAGGVIIRAYSAAEWTAQRGQR